MSAAGLTKRPCADCDCRGACDFLERCAKFDPAPKSHDCYKQLAYDAAKLERCPLCGCVAEVWQYSKDETSPTEKAVMCSHGDPIGPQDGVVLSGCLLFMAPQAFHQPTIREAVRFWNDFARALVQMRRTGAVGQTQAAEDVLAERRRQVEAEGWTPEHDDEHADYALSLAAASYAAAPELVMVTKYEDQSGGRGDTPVWKTYSVPELWPNTWHGNWWKPKDRRSDLVKAGALILAEIERLDRAAMKQEGGK